MTIAKSAAVLLAITFLSGCASSGPKHGELKASLPAVESGMGRIMFYRDRSVVGVAIQPDIRLNGEVVGTSTPGGFFFVDRRPGKYQVSVATETENSVEFELQEGQTQYVRTYVSMGILIGRAYPQLMDADQALADLDDLHYTGDPVLLTQQPSSPGPGGQASVNRGGGPVSMDELKDLLPGKPSP